MNTFPLFPCQVRRIVKSNIPQTTTLQYSNSYSSIDICFMHIVATYLLLWQDLVHQLHSAVAELQTARNSWPPWLHKTLNSIKEVANKKEQLSGGGALVTMARRDVVTGGGPTVIARRDSAPGLSRDSVSRESLHDM
jgi:hypothetical protein